MAALNPYEVSGGGLAYTCKNVDPMFRLLIIITKIPDIQKISANFPRKPEEFNTTI